MPKGWYQMTLSFLFSFLIENLICQGGISLYWEQWNWNLVAIDREVSYDTSETNEMIRS